MNTCKRNNQDCLLCSDEYAKQEFLCKNEPLSGYIIVKNPYRNLVHYPMDYLPSRLIKCNHCNSNIVDISAALFKLNLILLNSMQRASEMSTMFRSHWLLPSKHDSWSFLKMNESYFYKNLVKIQSDISSENAGFSPTFILPYPSFRS